MTDPLSEERFTPPRPDCPHPGWWHSVDDESTEIEVTGLVAAFVRALQPEVVIETGTAFGQTAEAIGYALMVNGHGRLITIEPDPDRYAESVERVAGLPVEVVPDRVIPSLLETRSVGFAWLDSLIPLRVGEARWLRPYLARGAIVGFHDTGPQHGYRMEVELLLEEGWLRGIHLPTPRGVLFAEVLG